MWETCLLTLLDYCTPFKTLHSAFLLLLLLLLLFWDFILVFACPEICMSSLYVRMSVLSVHE